MHPCSGVATPRQWCVWGQEFVCAQASSASARHTVDWSFRLHMVVCRLFALTCFQNLWSVCPLVASVRSLLASSCSTLYFQWPASATILPACQQLNRLVYAAVQLLDWQVPVDPGQASTASDAVCADPVVALVLLQVWVRLVLLVLLPCGLVYCLERSLKVGFLHTRYAGSNAAAASTPGSSAAAASFCCLQLS